jgi:lipid II:glycine glycyltransferase (peptidoglycan interpeptide bridge formation enzyme)
VARKAGVVQAILWHVWDNNRAYYLVGSKNPEIKDNRAVTALIWHAIKESNRLGKASFDFEGSMDPGVEHFFRNFGGERTLYMMLRKNTSLLWKLKELVRP